MKASRLTVYHLGYILAEDGLPSLRHIHTVEILASLLEIIVNALLAELSNTNCIIEFRDRLNFLRTVEWPSLKQIDEFRRGGRDWRG